MRTSQISSFTFGVTVFTTIKEVNTNEDATPLYDSGDTDTNETLVGMGVSRNSFSLILSDPIQAAAIKAHAAANITYSGVDEAGADVVDSVLTNARVFGRSRRTMHNGVWQFTLTGRCDAVTDAASA